MSSEEETKTNNLLFPIEYCKQYLVVGDGFCKRIPDDLLQPPQSNDDDKIAKSIGIINIQATHH